VGTPQLIVLAIFKLITSLNKLGRLFDRQIARFGTAQYFGDHPDALPKNVDKARTITEEHLGCSRRLSPVPDRFACSINDQQFLSVFPRRLFHDLEVF
jgi:hypothetical protein